MSKENNNIFLVFLILVFSTCFSSTASSETTTKLSVRGSGQIIPRFETLKFNEVRLRKGPSRDHPIDWLYKLKGLPLKIISEFDDWRKVEDFDGNITELEEKGILTPLFEEQIDKSTWTLMSQLSVNGNAWEGSTIAFWDDVVDTAETNSDNSYFIIWRDQNGGTLDWPLDIVINLNKNVRIHRFKVWQRAYWYNGPTGVPYYYQEENLRSFDLYASNNAQDWTLLGQFDIGDPSDGDGNIAENLLEAAAEGHDFDLDGVSDSFRYLKFSITSNYGSDTYCHGSEITLWGLDNVD